MASARALISSGLMRSNSCATRSRKGRAARVVPSMRRSPGKVTRVNLTRPRKWDQRRKVERWLGRSRSSGSRLRRGRRSPTYVTPDGGQDLACQPATELDASCELRVMDVGKVVVGQVITAIHETAGKRLAQPRHVSPVLGVDL